MLQLLSTDFDGTIVNHDTKPAVVPEMIAALRDLRAAGVKWAVNTGRTLGHMDDGLVREFALQGKGIALLPHFLCAEDLQAGRLKLVLKNWAHLSGPINVVYPSQRFVLPRVRAFLDHLVRECAQVRWRH